MGSLTPRLSLPYPALTDVADGPAAFQALAVALDRAAIDDQGAFSARPVSTSGTPGIKGRYFWATDQTILYRDNGTGWDQVTTSLPVDPDPTIPGLRTLGPGHQQACPGDDARLSDQRTPLDNSVTGAKVHTSLKPSGGASASTEALRSLGYGAGQAAAGLHSQYHQPAFNGGVDPIDYTKVNLFGTKNQRISRDPTTAPAMFWYETDTQDFYYSDGTAWVRVVQHALAGPTYLPIASFPPSSPTDGQELYLKIDARTVWHVRYEAADPTQYKWKCVGRQEPMYASMIGAVPVHTTPGAMVQVQLPRSGEYRLEAGSVFNRPAVAGNHQQVYLGTGIGGVQGVQAQGEMPIVQASEVNFHAVTLNVINDYAVAATGQSAAAYASIVDISFATATNATSAWIAAYPMRLS